MRQSQVAPIFRDKQKVEAVAGILEVEPELRSKEEENTLVDFLGRTGIFTKAENIESYRRLAKEVKIWKVIEGEYLFRQGELGECFYIILTGSVVGLAKSEEYDEYG